MRTPISHQFMPKRWQEHLRTYGSHLRTPYIGTTPYPRSSPLIARRDAWPPTGGPPGSDLAFMQKQYLDPLDVEFGILQVLDLFIFSQQNLEFGAAIQRAINDWQLAFWSDRDPRLKASILAGQDDTQLAIAEIERCAKIGRYVQINVCPRANEPLGRRRYWPIYARAQELGLPLGIHVGGYGGHAPTGGGWPSYYAEEHQSNAHTMAAQLTSLVLEGVPERFPKLKIVFIEGGFGWIPSATWRMDRHFEAFRSEVPHLKRRPSEYVKEHFWFTTQPIDEPDEGKTSALADRMGRRRPPAVLVGLSALGFRRSALCLQDAADGNRTGEDLQRQRARDLQILRTTAHGPAHRRPYLRHPARRQQGVWRRRPRHRRVPRQWRILRAAQSLSACRRAAGEGGLRGAADLAGARRLPALAGRRTAALCVAWLGIRHAQRPILVRSEARQDPLLSGRGRKRRGTAEGPYVAETFPVHVEDSYVIIET